MRQLCPVFFALTTSVTSVHGPAAAAPLQFPTTPPTEARDVAKTFHLLDGFQMQLIAAEPLVTDPVAITYDEDGRAYVCEMNDYPYTDKSTHKPSQENPTDLPLGKVRLLTDTDNDGLFDKATVFAEGLSWPTGAACWKGGVFVTATPDVWYLKDTNGDGVADVRQKIFTGFKKLNVQAVMNNPIWGLDHRIYVAGGSNGGLLQRVGIGKSVMPLIPTALEIKRHDFSFDPGTGDFRMESGGARFGNTFDDWGNRFLCNIRNPCQHVVLPHRYLGRNPYLVIPSTLNDCAEAGDQLPVYRTSPPEPWREFRAKRWVQEGSHLPKSELVGAGVVTSSAGITVYRGDAYPTDYRDFAFVADVAGNLFYRMKLVPDGVTFKALQVDGTKNFCTSDDLWHRPVNFVNAPDGCLHVCDMYREVIEHPWSIPDDIHAVVDLLRGRDKGRLYRLAPPNFKPHATPRLSAASTAELVALLDHPNAWHRETAQRLLYERQDKTAVAPLRDMARTGKTAQGRVHALHALHALGTLNEPELMTALTDPAPQVKQAALSILADRKNYSPDLKRIIMDLTASASPETALMLAHVCDRLGGEAAGAKGVLAQKTLEDPWMRRNLLLAPSDQAAGIATAVMDQPDSPALADFLMQAGNIVGGSRKMYIDEPGPNINAQWHVLLSALKSHGETHPAAVEAGLLGLNRGLSTQGLTILGIAYGEKMKGWIRGISSNAAQKAVNEDLPVESRVRAVPLLELGSFETIQETCRHLLMPTVAPELQTAALETLGGRKEPAVADLMIERWSNLSPVLRDKVTTLLLSRTDRIAKLLDAIEAKKITPAQLSAAAKATLGRQKNPVLAERITKLFGDGGSSNRKEVIAKYASVMTMTGDAASGAKIYEAACMVCHRHKDRGNDVGPNLGTIQGWTAEQIITNVFDPNREVSPNFALYVVETHDGRTLTGLIASETGGNLTLKRADGGTDTVLRSEIKSLTSPGISLMPEGLEAAITPQQMADLIAYLKGG
ncbi:MAG TPA: PVC-type heme-binding CxxCH protein [Prosthecobacter sp.]